MPEPWEETMIHHLVQYAISPLLFVRGMGRYG